jgi:hypothetical protein
MELSKLSPYFFHAANVMAQEPMRELAGSADRIVPGHDALQFRRFPVEG